MSPGPRLASLDVALVGIVSVLANLSWRLLEGPCLALKDRINYRYGKEDGPKG